MTAAYGMIATALRLVALSLGAALALAACIPTGTLAPRQYFLLEDVSAQAPPRSAETIDRRLLVGGAASDAFYESRSLVYSRAPGQRAYYQFAGWTDQPARRIGLLTERRLESRGRFRGVAPIDSGSRGDLLLTVTVDELLHDDAIPPGIGRVAITAELLQRSGRQILARERFVAAAPAPSEDAEGAVTAMNAAVSEAIDAIVVWAEEAAAQSVAEPAASTRG